MHRFLTARIGRGCGEDRRWALLPARVPVAAMLVAVLAVSGLVSCSSPTDTDESGDCGQMSPTPRSMKGQPREQLSGPPGGAGSASVARHSAPPAAAASPLPSPPTPVDGRVALTAANALQTIVVPANTMIDVRLDPVSGSVWTLPESSDPQALPRVSASGACDTVKVATFRAVRDGQINATRPQGDALVGLMVSIRVAG